MRLKKSKNKNEYLKTSAGVWVRNVYKRGTPAIDINDLSGPDIGLFLTNESSNTKTRFNYLEADSKHANIVIISDGFDFENKQKVLAELPKDVAIIAVNGALAKWKLIAGECKRAINYYVINNPYQEATHFLPKTHRYFPRCIASTRTCPQFLWEYEGNKLLYSPTPDNIYSGVIRRPDFYIDDYRNPIAASVNIAKILGVEKLLLFCCDDSFADPRPGAVKLNNGTYCYPQQQMSTSIIDGCLHWLKLAGVDIADHSSGPKLENASYIEVKDMVNFFKREEYAK